MLDFSTTKCNRFFCYLLKFEKFDVLVFYIDSYFWNYPESALQLTYHEHDDECNGANGSHPIMVVQRIFHPQPKLVQGWKSWCLPRQHETTEMQQKYDRKSPDIVEQLHGARKVNHYVPKVDSPHLIMSLMADV